MKDNGDGKGKRSSLSITEGQKERLHQLAERAGYTVGRGADSQLPAFLDHLMDVYPLFLEGNDGEEVWLAFIQRLGPLVEALKKRLGHWDVEISELLSPYGGVYVAIKDESTRVAPGRYAQREFGPAEFEAVGRVLV